MKPVRPDTDASQHWELIDRINRLESSAPRVITTYIPGGTSVIDLGSFDGENITGVRITGNVTVAGAGTSNPVLRVRPNALTGISVLALAHVAIWNTAAASTDLTTYAGNYASANGMMIAGSGWSTASNGVWFSGVMHTRKAMGMRKYLGQYANHDFVTNPQQHSFATVTSAWNDSTTDVTSLSLAIDAGTFSGRVTMETIP